MFLDKLIQELGDCARLRLRDAQALYLQECFVLLEVLAVCTQRFLAVSLASQTCKKSLNVHCVLSWFSGNRPAGAVVISVCLFFAAVPPHGQNASGFQSGICK